MKTFFALAILLTSSVSFARQYFQCSDTDLYSTEVAVVNLQTEEGGTLFLSSGMQNPEHERILLDIAFDRLDGEHHIYKIINSSRKGQVYVPTNVIGRAADSLIIDVSFNGFGTTYSCFTRIYND